MSASAHKYKENLKKMTSESLEETLERQCSILKNKKLIDKLPDKGKQLQENLEFIKKEIKLRQDIKCVEEKMDKLTIDSKNVDVLNEKHVQHICKLEKSPKKERYKPFATLVKHGNDSLKTTQLISLTESITLLSEQSIKSVDVTKPYFEDETNTSDNEEAEFPANCE